jgi:hypothetical protein
LRRCRDIRFGRGVAEIENNFRENGQVVARAVIVGVCPVLAQYGVGFVNQCAGNVQFGCAKRRIRA